MRPVRALFLLGRGTPDLVVLGEIRDLVKTVWQSGGVVYQPLKHILLVFDLAHEPCSTCLVRTWNISK